MATSTLKILREVNDYTQDFIAEDVLGISQTTYARIEQNPARITAEQAQKLSDLYQVSLANLLSEATPVITFRDSVKENTQSANSGYIQTQNYEAKDQGNADLLKALQEQNALLSKQNAELMDLIKHLKG